MPPRPLQFPFGGVADKVSFFEHPPRFARPGELLNMRPFDVAKDAGRGGKRPGTRAVFPTRICDGKQIQRLISLSLASSVTDYEVGECASVDTWENREAGPIYGQCFMLGATPSVFRNFYDNRGTTASAYACKWHPLETNGIRRAVFGTIFVEPAINGGILTSGIRLVDELGVTLWTASLEDRAAGAFPLPPNPREIYVNHVTIAAPVLGNAIVLVSVLAVDPGPPGVLQGYVYVFKATDGTYIRRYSMNGHAAEVIQSVVRPDGKIAVLFYGSGGAGATVGQPIAEGLTASHFRSGIMLFEYSNNPADLVAAGNPLTQVSFSSQLASNHPYFETAHGYFRFSEKLRRAPRGCYPTSMCARPDNSLVVTFTNEGWGPNGDLAFHHPRDEFQAYSTVALITQTGVLSWEADTRSMRRDYTGAWGTYHNDIPDDGDPFGARPASLCACCSGPSGEIYVGGARNSDSSSPEEGENVFRISQIDGSILWATSVGGATATFGDAPYSYSGGVAQGAMVVDPTDNNLLVGGRRTDAWGNQAGNTPALLWKFNAETSAAVWTFDLYNGDAGDTDAAAAKCYGVDVDASGLIMIVTDRLVA